MINPDSIRQGVDGNPVTVSNYYLFWFSKLGQVFLCKTW